MHKLTLQLRLLDDVVFSASSATEGGHASLDYIPGAALLGWAASRLYHTLRSEDAWLLFHSGKVRFGHGLPLPNQTGTALPVPACLHYAKGVDWRVADYLCPERVFNLLHTAPDNGVQYKQLREGYVSPDGMLFYPEKSLSMKTAINPDTGRAAESQLFGYEALVAGQQFVTTITADADVPEELFLKLHQACLGLMHLGRSRSSQYGRVEGVEINGRSGLNSHDDAGEFTSLTLWLTADMALYRHGQPLLKPEPGDLGLPTGRLVAEKSFVRSRRYAPYNAKRRAPDLERQVLAAGSVLHFELDEPVNAALLPDSFGLFREAGLGTVLINPSLLAAEHPVFEQSSDVAVTVAVSMPEHPLVAWLRRESAAIATTAIIHQRVEELMQELTQLYKTAASMSGIADTGPGSSQWGRVRDIAMQTDGLEQLKNNLFGNDGVCKDHDEAWIQWAQLGEGFITFRAWLQDIVDGENSQDIASLIALLARDAAAIQAQKGVRS